jgi:hypothetical protein
MDQLIGAERMPEAGVLRRQAITLNDLLLR